MSAVRPLRLRPRVVAAVAVFAVSAALYAATLARTVGFIDRGELAAVAATLGIAHPTGYPTLTLLAHAVLAAVPARPVVVLNVFAALLVALGAAALALLFDAELERAAAGRPAPPGRGRSATAHAAARARERGTGDRNAAAVEPAAAAPGDVSRAACAGLAALLVATSVTWWQQANGFEVYAFQALLLPLVLLVHLRDLDRGTIASGFGFGVVAGLASTNHLTVVLLVPAILIGLVVRFGWGRAWRRIAWPIAPGFALGLLPYLWLPIRAAMNPALDWGEPRDLSGLIAHVTGRQYQLLMFESADIAARQLAYAARRLPWDLAVGGALLAALGAVHLARRAPVRLAAAAALVVAGLVFVAGYGIRDIDPYALPALIGLGVLVAAGLAFARDRFGARAAWVVGALLVIANVGLHYRSCDESRQTMVEDLVHQLLEPLPPRAVLLTSLWDHVASPALYLQGVERLRPDVTVVHTGLIEHPWYRRQLGRRDPGLMPEGAGRLAAAPGAEAQMAALIARCIGSRRVFTTCELRLPEAGGYRRVPCGLAEELRRDTAYVACPLPAFRIRPWIGRVDLWVASLHLVYGQSLADRMDYELQHGRRERAAAIGRIAAALAPPFGIDDIPSLAADGTELARQSVTFFDRLKTATARLESPR